MRCWIALVLLYGCGAPSREQPDGAVGGAVDAARDTGGAEAGTDAREPNVELVSTFGRRPIPGITFYVQGAAATSAVTTVVSDANGEAWAAIEPDSYVTAVFPAALDVEGIPVFESRGGVQPGDRLVFVPPQVDPDPDLMQIRFAAQRRGFVEYSLFASCDNESIATGDGIAAGTPLTFVVNLSACGPTMDFAIVARDEDGSEETFVYEPNVPAIAGSTLDLTAAVFVEPPIETGTLLNASATSWVSRSAAYPRGWALENSGDPSGFPAPLPAGTASYAFNGSQLGPMLVEETTWPADGPSLLFDAAAVDLASFATYPAWSQADHAVTWTPGPGSAPTYGAVDMTVEHLGARSYHEVREPLATGTLAFPRLPADDIEPGDVVTIRTADEQRQPWPFSWTTLQAPRFDLYTQGPGRIEERVFE